MIRAAGTICLPADRRIPAGTQRRTRPVRTLLRVAVRDDRHRPEPKPAQVPRPAREVQSPGALRPV
ncbi:MAG: hypothetical protein AUK55_03310 [Syntrophobacteraceae bacterium CG2_30_61_12]|nr:MAG: hypothetical protein AUK55_03310 [Syntrophobacteraceae bacterium CG2_30_61_12]PIU32234.1 MAG: hypothetical protein COT06_03820 [Syntrophobacteraceae bacterium CG07_land_8_20_14_0_80_61_8]